MNKSNKIESDFNPKKNKACLARGAKFLLSSTIGNILLLLSICISVALVIISPINITVVCLIYILLFYLSGNPFADKVSTLLYKAGIYNKQKEPPILTDIKYEKRGGNKITIYTFESYGISLQMWQEKRGEIENALNVNMVNIMQGANKRTVQLYAVSGNAQLENKTFSQSLLPENDYEIILGYDLIGDIAVNINNQPHFLIGGTTGSGKTVLFKTIIEQFILHGNTVYIADLKGGVDFYTQKYEQQLILDRNTLIETLDEVLKEIEKRMDLYPISGSKNITEFRAKFNSDAKRILVACDEITMLLNKDGANKEEKEKIEKLTKQLTDIASIGRAFGVHLLLATQRPDAQVLDGKIKNNIDTRVCGKADKILSNIILGHYNASTIPKNIAGRFMLEDESVFQGYYID